MMKLEELKSKLEITVDSEHELIDQLKSARRTLHPDNFGGEFNSEKDKDLYFEIDMALDLLERHKKEVNVISESNMGQLVTIMNSLITKNENANLLETKSNKMEKNIKTYIKRKKQNALFPQVTSTLLTGIISAIWLFPDQISNHPILSQYIDITSIQFVLIWMVSILVSLEIWIITKYSERKTNIILDEINSSQFQNRVFNEFINECTKDNFTKSEFVYYLQNYIGENVRIGLIFRAGIDANIIEDLAEVIIERANQKEIIFLENIKRLDDVYRIS